MIDYDMIESYKYTYDEEDHLTHELHTVSFPNRENNMIPNSYVAEDGTMVTEFVSEDEMQDNVEKRGKLIAAALGCIAGLLIGKLLK